MIQTERGGRAIISVVRHFTAEVTRELEELHLFRAERVDTDGARSYLALDALLHHESVNHSAREYARYGVHDNTCEGIGSLLRQFLSEFRGVCKKNLAYFVALFEFTYNRRHLPPQGRFAALLGAIISYGR